MKYLTSDEWVMIDVLRTVRLRPPLRAAQVKVLAEIRKAQKPVENAARVWRRADNDCIRAEKAFARAVRPMLRKFAAAWRKADPQRWEKA